MLHDLCGSWERCVIGRSHVLSLSCAAESAAQGGLDARSRHRIDRPHSDRPAPIAAPSTTRRRRHSPATSIAEAVRRAGIDPAEVEDVVLGAGAPAGHAPAQRRPSGGDPRRIARSRSRR